MTAGADYPCPVPDPSAQAVRLPDRLRYALTHPANWFEVLRYSAVGLTGYLISVVSFAVAVELGCGYILAATIAFGFALVNNFVFNRSWTFRATDGRIHIQWVRFVVVNVAVFVFSLGVLYVLIEQVGLHRVLAQAIAVAAAAPPNFGGQKLWSFRT